MFDGGDGSAGLRDDRKSKLSHNALGACCTSTATRAAHPRSIFSGHTLLQTPSLGLGTLKALF